MKIQIEIEVSSQDVDDILTTALEGGINYWCDEAKAVNVNAGNYSMHLSEAFASGSTDLEIVELDDEGTVTLTQENFKKGLAKFLKEYGLNCLSGEGVDLSMIDADNADIIIQLAVFDEIKYG